MRVWDVDPSILCKDHLLGEHRELHCIFTVISEGKKGYSHHPETKRWVGKLAALRKRHELLVMEMKRRWPKGSHKSHLPEVHDCDIQDVYVDIPERQIELLRSKRCKCCV